MAMSPSRKRKAGRSILVAVAGLAIAGSAHALEPEITGEATGQFYELRSPTGETILERRRLTATLGLSGYELLKPDPKDRGGPELTFRARVRYDADYGAHGEESNLGQTGSAQYFVPGFSRGPVDLMYAYVEGRRFLHGTLGFKLGRQYQTDVLGWWSFDGAQVNVTTPFYVRLEGYGGLEQRGGLPLSTSRYESDGVWRGSRSGFDPSLYPQFQPANIAPAFGVALDSAGPTWIHGRVVYRRVYNTGSVGASDFSNGLYQPTVVDDARISSDRLGYAVDVDLGKLAGLKGGLVYDFYNTRLTSAFVSIDSYEEGPVAVSLDYDYYAPVFDADSIWNFFAGDPMNDVGLRANLTPTERLSISAGGHVRIYDVQTSPDNPYDSSPNAPNIPAATLQGLYPTNGHPFDGGGSVGARYKWPEGNVSLRGAADAGDNGDRVGGDLSAEDLVRSQFLLRGRLGVWQWDDKLRPDRDATNFGYVAGVGYRFAPRCQAVFEWQHDINRLVGQRFRTMLTLSVALLP
jgi:hypothetical protein